MVHLLIADDEQIERAVLTKMLRKNLGKDCMIYEACNGREALNIWERSGVDVAILDIEMPGISGIEAAEKIREAESARKGEESCKFVFLTAFDKFSYAQKGIKVHALDYILKPWEENELMSAVEKALRLCGGSMQKAGAVPQEPLLGFGYGQGQADAPVDGRLTKIGRVIDTYIKNNYMYELSVQDVAQTMNYSEAYFCRLFKQCFRQNFTSYLAAYRIEEAKRLLAEPTANVKDIAKAVGYPDSNYFAKVFKRITGQSPTEYRSACLM